MSFLKMVSKTKLKAASLSAGKIIFGYPSAQSNIYEEAKVCLNC